MPRDHRHADGVGNAHRRAASYGRDDEGSSRPAFGSGRGSCCRRALALQSRRKFCHGPGARGRWCFEQRDIPKIIKPTDAIIRISATCVCGSDLWPYRGIQPIAQPTPMGHEYCGIVEEIGSAVKSVKPGQFVIGSFFASDNTCPNCEIGYQSSCQHAEFVGTAQASVLRVPLADGTLVSTPTVPSDDMIPRLLTLSDVMGTGWFAADAANVKPGSTVAVVGDGAVGLLGVLSAKQMGAKRIIAMSRHESRQKLAREFGATDIVTERGDEGVAHIKELTNGTGADSVLECVGTQESMMQAITSTRKGGYVSYVGVPHGVTSAVNSGSLRMSTCMVAPRQSGASCRRWSSWCGNGRSIPARFSILPCRSTKWPKDTERWTSAARLRRYCGRRASRSAMTRSTCEENDEQVVKRRTTQDCRDG